MGRGRWQEPRNRPAGAIDTTATGSALLRLRPGSGRARAGPARASPHPSPSPAPPRRRSAGSSIRARCRWSRSRRRKHSGKRAPASRMSTRSSPTPWARNAAKEPVRVLGAGESHCQWRVAQCPDLTVTPGVVSSREAFGTAGSTPKDVDVLEPQDNFSHAVAPSGGPRPLQEGGRRRRHRGGAACARRIAPQPHLRRRPLLQPPGRARHPVAHRGRAAAARASGRPAGEGCGDRGCAWHRRPCLLDRLNRGARP
jgi:hypothetical protein